MRGGNSNISWLCTSFKNCKYLRFFSCCYQSRTEKYNHPSWNELNHANICERRKSVQHVRYICKNAHKCAWMSINKYDSYNVSVFQRDSYVENYAIETLRRRDMESFMYCNLERGVYMYPYVWTRVFRVIFTSVKNIYVSSKDKNGIKLY